MGIENFLKLQFSSSTMQVILIQSFASPAFVHPSTTEICRFAGCWKYFLAKGTLIPEATQQGQKSKTVSSTSDRPVDAAVSTKKARVQAIPSRRYLQYERVSLTSESDLYTLSSPQKYCKKKKKKNPSDMKMPHEYSSLKTSRPHW